MTLPNYAVRAALVNALAGLTLQGKPVGVFDLEAPTTWTGPRVIIQDQLNVSQPTKQEHSFRHEVNISAVDIAQQPTGRKRCDELVNLILARLIPSRPGRPLITLGAPYQVWDVQLTDQRNLDLLQPGQYVYREVLTIQLSIDLNA